jgi:hypothetical protein
MKHLTPMKAIRAKCLDCSGGSSSEVRLCEIEDCPLYPWRFGKRPQTVARRAVLAADRAATRAAGATTQETGSEVAARRQGLLFSGPGED